MKHIGTIIDTALKEFRIASDSEMTRIWDLWDGAVGETIAENAKPGAFKKDVLLVHVSNSTWMHHLRFLKQQMIDDINHALGQNLVKEIKFKIASLHS